MTKMGLTEMLQELEALYTKWELPHSNYLIEGTVALKLQGYDVQEMQKEHTVDVKMPIGKYPWKSPTNELRPQLPPRGSKLLEDYFQFIRRTGWGIAFQPIHPGSEWMNEDTIEYVLPNGRSVRINTPTAEINLHAWLLQVFGEEEFGREKLECWIDYLAQIKKEASKKGETDVAKYAERALGNSKILPKGRFKSEFPIF